MTVVLHDSEVKFNWKQPLLGIYRALVIDNKDPSYEEGLCDGKKLGTIYGRVKVFIPALMEKDDNGNTPGIWAFPANNTVGGRNHNSVSLENGADPWQKYYGSCMIPAVGSYVFIFFEGGDPSSPFYFGACDIAEEQVPPENRLGNNWQDKWTIFRSLKGRTVIVSDDPTDERTEITGKKRIDPVMTSSHVYNIDNNQKTILIDDRSGLEKILIKDQKGNFINICTENDTLHIYVNKDIHIKSDDGTIYIQSEKGINIKSKEDVNIESTDGSINLLAKKNLCVESEESLNLISSKDKVTINSNKEMEISSTIDNVYVDGQEVHLNQPHSSNPVNANSADDADPKGDRDNNC